MTDSVPTETEYLTAKRSLDDRALDRRVLEKAMGTLPRNRPARIVEVGAGTGTMCERLAEWDAFPGAVRYRAIERNAKRVETARVRLPNALSTQGFTVEVHGEDQTGPTDIPDNTWSFTATRADTQLEVSVESGDALSCEDNADLLIGCAFFDLVELPDAIRSLQSLLASGGVVYAPLLYDGLTAFVPSHPSDDLIVDAYHRHMVERSTPGGPDAGRQFLDSVRSLDGTVLAAASSDWILRPVEGSYPADEQRVLSFLLSTIESSVRSLDPPVVAPAVLDEWSETRQQQMTNEELTLLAHNLDVCCQL